MSKDHVHILAICPPTMAPSEIMRRIQPVMQTHQLELVVV